MQQEDEVNTGTQERFTGGHTQVLVLCSHASPDIGASDQDMEAVAEGGLASHSGYAASRTVSASSIVADPTVKIPTRWSDQDRSKLMTLSEDGRSLHFHSKHFPLPRLSPDKYLNLTFSLQTSPLSTTGGKEAAAARANHPIPPECIIYYFEVTILNKGRKG